MKGFYLSLVRKVLLIFPLVLLPIFAVFLVSYQNNKREIEKLIFDNLKIIAEVKEGDILQFLEMVKGRVQDFASDGMIIDRLEKAGPLNTRENAYLSEYLIKNKLPLLKNTRRLYIISPGGRVLASTHSAAGEDVSQEEFFIKGKEAMSVVERVSGYLNEPEIAVSAPISDKKGRCIGVLAGFVPFSGFQRLFTGENIRDLGAVSWNLMRGRKTLDIYLVNKDKLMLTRPRFLGSPVLKRKVDTPPVRACLTEKRGFAGMYTDHAGAQVAGVSMCFPRMKWTLLAEMDKDEILAPVAKNARYAVMTITVTAWFIGVLVFYFVNVVISQLRGVAAGAKEIASGNYEIHIPVKSRDEIGILSESFNNMAEEIKKRDASLRERGEQLQAILNNTTNAVYLKDTEGRYILANHVIENLAGLRKGEIYGKTDFDIFPREEAEAFRVNDLKALESEGPVEVEEKLESGGESHTYISVKSRIPGPDGVAYAICGISTDITDVKRSGETLRRSEASLANAQRIARLGNWDWDIVKNEMHWSDEIYRIFEAGPHEFNPSYEAFQCHVHPADLDLFKKSVNEALYGGKPYSVDFRVLVYRNGEKIEKTVHDQGEVTFDEKGNPVKMVGIVQDITERKKAERSLMESERKYRTLVDNALVGVYRTNLKGDILYANEALAGMLEFDSTQELASGQVLSRYKDKRQRAELIDKLRQSGRVEAMEGMALTKTGKTKSVLLTANLEGDIISGMIIDITGRKKAEDEVRRLNEELEKRVMERTSQLEYAVSEIEAFSYSVAHDLRTPLRLIDGFSHILLEDYSGLIDKRGVDYLMRVRGASQRMGRLIDDLLELSRVSRTEMRREEVDLSAMVMEIAASLRKAEPARNAEFIIQKDLSAVADPRLLRIVFENLMGNAWKFTGKKDMALIEFGKEGVKEGRPVYFVRDNGAGFNMKYAEKLFEPFQRLHSTDQFPGTGIGLATVQRIISRHGGKVWAEGEVGKGAAFYFSL